MAEKKTKSELTIKIDCSYGINKLNAKKEVERFHRKFLKGEKLKIVKDLGAPFKENKISPEMANMIILNKQGG